MADNNREQERRFFPPSNRAKTALNSFVFFLVIFGINAFMYATADRGRLDAREKTALENFIASLIILVGSLGGNLLFAGSSALYDRIITRRPISVLPYLLFTVVATLVFSALTIGNALTNQAFTNPNNPPANPALNDAQNGFALVAEAGVGTVLLGTFTRLVGVPMPLADLAQFAAGMTDVALVGRFLMPLVPGGFWAQNAAVSATVTGATAAAGFLGSIGQGPSIDEESRPLLDGQKSNVQITGVDDHPTVVALDPHLEEYDANPSI